jgi:hypothetical protein
MKIKTDFYTLIPFDNVLYIESYESWDERVVTDFVGYVRQVALQNYKKKAWAILHDGREWKLGTPAIESMVTQFMNTPLTNTITHHAFVTGPSEVKKWQIGKIFENVTGYEVKFLRILLMLKDGFLLLNTLRLLISKESSYVRNK